MRARVRHLGALAYPWRAPSSPPAPPGTTGALTPPSAAASCSLGGPQGDAPPWHARGRPLPAAGVEAGVVGAGGQGRRGGRRRGAGPALARRGQAGGVAQPLVLQAQRLVEGALLLQLRLRRLPALLTQLLRRGGAGLAVPLDLVQAVQRPVQVGALGAGQERIVPARLEAL